MIQTTRDPDRTVHPRERIASSPERTVGSLLKDLAEESRMLMRQELELAKAEMSQKAARLGRAAMFVAVGGAVLYAGFLALVAFACIGVAVGLSLGIASNIAVWLGPLLVGIVICIIGFAFVMSAIHTFKNESLAPRETMDSLREDKEWFKEQITTDTHTR